MASHVLPDGMRGSLKITPLSWVPAIMVPSRLTLRCRAMPRENFDSDWSNVVRHLSILQRLRHCQRTLRQHLFARRRSLFGRGGCSASDPDRPTNALSQSRLSFVVGTVESHVARHDVLWVSGIHGENVEADVAAVASQLSAPAKQARWDFDPCHAAVYRLV